MSESDLPGWSIVARLGVVFLLVAANAFFVAAEFALVGARKTQIESLARRGNRRAQVASHAIAHIDHYISGTQLGITLASLALGWIGETTVAALLIELFEPLGRPLSLITTHAVAATVAFTFISFLHIVLGELAPKSVAILFPETTSLWTAGPLIVFSRILSPFIYVLNGAANLLLRAFGLRPPSEVQRVHRPEEIEMLVRQMHEHAQLAAEPAHMIRGALALAGRTVADVMTPRTEVVALNADTSLDEAAQSFLRSELSRLPVYRDGIDEIVGIALARDVWRATSAAESTTLVGLVRPTLYVPDTKPVVDLLREMQRERIHMAIVLDEFGGTAGVVTLEDLIEEIVGEIHDEDEREPEPIRAQGDGTFQLTGGASLSELNDRFSLNLPAHEFTTVGGYVMGRLGRLASAGDIIDFKGGSLQVEAMSGRRIEVLTLMLAPPRTGTA